MSTAARKPRTTTIKSIPSRILLNHVAPFLQPTDLVRLAHTNRRLRKIHTHDSIWEPLVRAIDNKRFLKALNKTKVLEYGNNSLMLAWLVGTWRHCIDCGKPRTHVDTLTLVPVCQPCFDEWGKTGLVKEAYAKTDYQLTYQELRALPHHETGWRRSSLMFARSHVEEAALKKWGSFKALRGEKERVRRMTQAEYDYKMSVYRQKCAAAVPRGLPRPPPPQKPLILNVSLNLGNTRGTPGSHYHKYVVHKMP